ncbi:CASP-like protein 4D1 [Morus notabilis]|uniref:CASP-like protein 4D1 n=1 Tax=Morus notabilis TaxID=981085 RepID=UPI000CECFA02|nr:CASP-like protein 4D1 [Morus notabilis]
MARSAASRTANLVLRVFTIVLLLISLIVICSNTKTDEYTGGRIKFQDVIAYRYMLSAIVIGTAYALLQLAFAIYNAVSNGEGNHLFDFYGDKIASYLLATGAAAGFGVTNDMKTLIELLSTYDFGNFYEKAYASASLLFLAFVCTM